MEITWHADLHYRGFYDPKAEELVVVAGRHSEAGSAHSANTDCVLALGADEDFSHLALAIDASCSGEVAALADDCPRADSATVDVEIDERAGWVFDQARMALRVEFGAQAVEWGRIGDNALWLALDAEGCLAQLVVEGIVLDPGGSAQAAWLDEIAAADDA